MSEENLYAKPLDMDANGFYFQDFDDFEDKSSNLKNHFGIKIDEFEIIYMEGENSRLFDVCGINQTNLQTWFDDVVYLSENEKAALFFLMDNNFTNKLSDAITKVIAGDVCVQKTCLFDAAADFFDECYLWSVPENIRFYIDYEKFASDCKISGDLVEFEFNNTRWTCTNASGI